MELWWAVELLVSIMEAGVFTATAPSNWMEVAYTGQWIPFHETPIQAAATAEVAGPTQGGPCQWSVVRADLLPLQRWMHLPLHPRK